MEPVSKCLILPEVKQGDPPWRSHHWNTYRILKINPPEAESLTLSSGKMDVIYLLPGRLEGIQPHFWGHPAATD